jgi:hypothetical protein
MARELVLLQRDPPPGVWCGPASTEIPPREGTKADDEASVAKRSRSDEGANTSHEQEEASISTTAPGGAGAGAPAARDAESAIDVEIDKLHASILGAAGTPYEGGEFKLELTIPATYPYAPPKVRFLTPIYHPNVDNVGRICLDLLKMPPAVRVGGFATVCPLPLSVNVGLPAPYSLARAEGILEALAKHHHGTQVAAASDGRAKP